MNVPGKILPYWKKDLELRLLSYAGISQADLEQLWPYVEVQSYKKGAIILSKGTREDYLRFVVQGVARKYYVREDTVYTIQIALLNELITSEFSFFRRTPSWLTVEALTNCTFLALSYEGLAQLTTLYGWADELMDKLLMLGCSIKEEAIAGRAGNNKQQFTLSYLKQHPDLLLNVPQQIVASYIGVKPETLSAIKRQHTREDTTSEQNAE